MEEVETGQWILAHFLGLLRVLCDLQSRLSFRVNLHESLACKWTFYSMCWQTRLVATQLTTWVYHSLGIPKTHFFFSCFQQTKENDELTKICDDLILKMEKI